MNVHHCQSVKGPIHATVRLPGSKSITNRALITAALADGTSLLKNILLAEDTWLMIGVLRKLGISITVDENDSAVEVTGCRGCVPVEEGNLFCGNAGTVIRFNAALVSLGYGRFMLDGTARMRQRSIGGLGDALRRLGVGVEYLQNEGFPPVAIHAKGLRGGHVEFTDPESSQFISALLLASPYASADVFIEGVGDVPSRPYLTMTTAVMDSFGVVVLEGGELNTARGRFRFVVEASQRFVGRTYAIEPDATNASYFLAIPAVTGGRVVIEDLGSGSIQGDIIFVDVLESMGCRVEREPTSLAVTGPSSSERLRGIDVDLNAMPDTVPTLAVLSLFAEGPTTIRNVANLRIKETDRLAALACELTKLGAKVAVLPDGLQIEPPRQIRPASIETYGDHRMAMSFALAGLKCEGLEIRDPECCAKTFPLFFQEFDQLKSS